MLGCSYCLVLFLLLLPLVLPALHDGQVLRDDVTEVVDLPTQPEFPVLKIPRGKVVGTPPPDTTCNHEDLRRIIYENIAPRSPTQSKRAIYSSAIRELGAYLNVICSRASFSYLTTATLYCQHARGNVTCYAFRS